MELGPLLELVIQGRDLADADARELMTLMVRAETTPAQTAGFLVALRSKGVTGSELAAFASVLREHAVCVPHNITDLVEIVGTGGGAPSLNISTGASLVAAAAGAKVAKHGNRAVTSACGSADVLEALGVKLDLDPSAESRVLAQCGFVFMLAPLHHPALKNVGPIRKELGVRTVFNQLGPLANPAGTRCQVIGVYDRSLCKPMAEALRLLGARRALVVHSDDGLDEISPCAPTRFHKVWDGHMAEGALAPHDFGLSPLHPDALTPAATVAEGAELLRVALSDATSLQAQTLYPSAATALWLAGLAPDLPAGASMARDAIACGAAGAKLAQVVEATNEA